MNEWYEVLERKLYFGFQLSTEPDSCISFLEFLGEAPRITGHRAQLTGHPATMTYSPSDLFPQGSVTTGPRSECHHHLPRR